MIFIAISFILTIFTLFAHHSKQTSFSISSSLKVAFFILLNLMEGFLCFIQISISSLMSIVSSLYLFMKVSQIFCRFIYLLYSFWNLSLNLPFFIILFLSDFDILF